ncbi:MAG: hypothetical protein HRT72_10585 [Flavobacteriales bacterium]|nr:hypothetical protein [Flavobacteriales bacterium]
MTESNFDLLLNKLDGFIRKYYKNLLLKGVILSVAIILVYFLTITLLEHFVRFDTGIRMFLFYSFLATTGYVFFTMICIPVFKIFSFGKQITYEQAAKVIGSHFNSIDDKILNAIQLNNLSGENKSNELLIASISQKIDQIKEVNFSMAIDFSENKKYLGYALAPIALLLLISMGAPQIISSGSQRIIKHNDSFTPPAPFKFIVDESKLTGIQQNDFEIVVDIEGSEIPKEVFIEFNNHQYKLRSKNKLSYTYTFTNVQKNSDFKFHANEIYSKEYELNVHPNPTVLDFSVNLIYPRYINRTNENLKNIGDLSIPIGTKVEWTFNTKDANSVEVIFDEKAEIIDQSGDDEYTNSKLIFKNETYGIRPINDYVKSKEVIQYFISAIPDRYPSIEIEGKVDSVLLTKFYFAGIIKDDYGFSTVKLNYRIASEATKGSVSEFKSETVQINKNVNEQKFYHLWDLSSLGLKSDEEIFYYFEVWDNDGVNGSKSTRTQIKTYHLPDYNQLAQENSKNNDKIKELLKKSIKDASELQKELDKLNKEALNKKNLDWSDKKRMEDLIKKQKELRKNVEKIQNENEKNAQKQTEFMNLSEESQDMQKQIEELFEEIMSEEMKEKFEELENMLTEMDKKDLQEALKELQFDSEEYEQELERTLEIFKLMEFEIKLDKMIDRLEELAEEQKKQSEETLDKNKSDEEKKADQEKLNKEFSDLQKEMEELEKMNKELNSPAEMKNTEQEQQAIKQDMQQSSKSLEKSQDQKASEAQQDAAEKMEEMAQQMEQMQEEMEASADAISVEKLKEILENLMTISFDQEDLMEEVKKTNRNDPRFLSHIQEQFNIKENSELVQDSLIALAKTQPEVKSIILKEMAEVNQNIDKSIQELLDNKISQSSYHQQLVMTSINNLALLLDEAKDQLNKQMAQQQKKGKSKGDCKKPSNKQCDKPGSCNKPGHGKPGKGKKPGEGIGGMKALQKQLNERLKKGMNGKMQSKELVQLAAKQEAIRRELQKMQQKQGKDGDKKGGNGKGDLEKIQQLMEQTEKDIVHGSVNQQTIQRQQEIFTRLLEAEKAEKEREWDHKRESKEAQSLDEIVSPPDFTEYYHMKEKEIELLKTIPPSLNKFYKNKVNDYFNSLQLNL